VAFSKKGAQKEGRTIVFADQSGFYLLPAVVRTYAPVGQTPILREHMSRDHLSAMSGITLEGNLYMTFQERAFKGEDVVRFLKHLMRQVPGKLLVIWDGSPIHRSKAVKKFLSLMAPLNGFNWSSFPATHQISIPRREYGSTSSVWR
jgi:hypothetical protein